MSSPRLLTLAEAAHFLRKSKSWLYQNPRVPRHRPPGSRCYLFDLDELLAWLKQGKDGTCQPEREPAERSPEMDKAGLEVYHRNARYR